MDADDAVRLFCWTVAIVIAACICIGGLIAVVII